VGSKAWKLRLEFEPDKALFSCEQTKKTAGVSQSFNFGFWILNLRLKRKTKSESKTMKCENLQLNLSVYLDDILTDDERAEMDGHLAQCPLCRQKAAEFQSLKNSLRVMARPEMPSDLLISLRNRVAVETQTFEQKPASVLTEDFRRWLLMRFMPYGVGTVVSVVLVFGLLWALLVNTDNGQNNEIARLQPIGKSSVLLANANQNFNYRNYESSATEFDVPNLSISAESPSINPQGALIALTKSFVRGKMKDDEVVVVAEVFGNGLARIDEVVEPSRNRQAVRELEEALKSDPNYAPPFVPAHFDQRSDTVRVVFKIQSVNIDTHLKPERR
jgi:hypothetical protein